MREVTNVEKIKTIFKDIHSFQPKASNFIFLCRSLEGT